jgi:hypothetical protein
MFCRGRLAIVSFYGLAKFPCRYFQSNFQVASCFQSAVCFDLQYCFAYTPLRPKLMSVKNTYLFPFNLKLRQHSLNLVYLVLACSLDVTRWFSTSCLNCWPILIRLWIFSSIYPFRGAIEKLNLVISFKILNWASVRALLGVLYKLGSLFWSWIKTLFKFLDASQVSVHRCVLFIYHFLHLRKRVVLPVLL